MPRAARAEITSCFFVLMKSVNLSATCFGVTSEAPRLVTVYARVASVLAFCIVRVDLHAGKRFKRLSNCAGLRYCTVLHLLCTCVWLNVVYGNVVVWYCGVAYHLSSHDQNRHEARGCMNMIMLMVRKWAMLVLRVS